MEYLLAEEHNMRSGGLFLYLFRVYVSWSNFIIHKISVLICPGSVSLYIWQHRFHSIKKWSWEFVAYFFFLLTRKQVNICQMCAHTPGSPGLQSTRLTFTNRAIQGDPLCRCSDYETDHLGHVNSAGKWAFIQCPNVAGELCRLGKLHYQN